MNDLVKAKSVKASYMILISVLPFGWVYVFRKLGRMKFGFLLTTVTVIPVVIINYTVGFPWGIISSLTSMVITCFIIRNLCITYNKRFET